MSLLSCWLGKLMRIPAGKPHSLSKQLISADGEFDQEGFKSFLGYVKYHEHGVESNALVVAIIGQQSSGKSTLMNHLFRTNFKEMDALHARGATTKGIWIAEALETKPLTIAVDLEGTDGSERGEDDKAFERQSALFALVISDVLIVNMCCKNVGLDQGGNRPLLKIIFEVMMRLFPPHKTTLLFVLRDKTTSPFEMLESDLKKDVKKIWETAVKPPGHENTPLSQIFNVEVAALSNYESAPHLFAEEVARLRCRLFNSIGRRNQHDNVVVPGSEILSFNGAKITWDIIKGCKDLDFPSNKVMVATVKCEQIAKEKLGDFASDEDLLNLHKEATTTLVSDFSARAKAILDNYLSKYDSECMHYDKDVSDAKREYLKSEALKVVRPAYMNTLGRRRSNALQDFEKRLEAALSEGGGFVESVQKCQNYCVLQFNEQCDSDDATFSSDVSTVRHELLREIETHWGSVRTNTRMQIEEQQRERLSRKFATKLRNFLCDRNDNDIWGRIRDLVRSECDAAALVLSSAVAKLGLDTAKVEEMVGDLKQRARELMVKTLKHETEEDDILVPLKQRYVSAFMNVNGSVGTDEELIKDADRKCVKLLSSLAVIRFDESYDNVESVLLSTLMGTEEISPDPLASQKWEKVPEDMTLITPVRCRDIWNQFKAATGELYPTAKFVEEQCVKAKHWRLPTWVIIGLLALGCVGVVAIIRFTNIDVLVALLGYAVTGLSMAISVMDIGQRIHDYDKQQDDSVGFWRRHRNFLKSIQQTLRKFVKFMNSLLGKRASAEVAAKMIR